MLAPILIFVGVVVTAISGIVGGWIGLRVQRSGRVETSEAKDLWDTLTAELAASRLQIGELRLALDRQDERLRQCQETMMSMRIRDMRKEMELGRLRRKLYAATGESVPPLEEPPEESTG